MCGQGEALSSPITKDTESLFRIFNFFPEILNSTFYGNVKLSHSPLFENFKNKPPNIRRRKLLQKCHKLEVTLHEQTQKSLGILNIFLITVNCKYDKKP